MHPLVRDLYKRVILVGRDYPTGWDHVKSVWKEALRNPKNCPSWWNHDHPNSTFTESNRLPKSSQVTSTGGSVIQNDEEEILRAVHRGRLAVKEMIGVIQLKKYRNMKQRYENVDE